MNGTLDSHGMTFHWEFTGAPSSRSGYRLRVSFGELELERDYPVRMSRTRAEKEAARLAQEVLKREGGAMQSAGQ
jgi:hypothetical protein